VTVEKDLPPGEGGSVGNMLSFEADFGDALIAYIDALLRGSVSAPVVGAGNADDARDAAWRGAVALVEALVERAAAGGCPWIFSTDLRTAMRPETVNGVVTKIAAAHRAALREEDATRLLPTPYSARDIRAAVETILAARGVSRDVRAQLQSHGLGGVQARHYDAHAYTVEKRTAVAVLHAALAAIANPGQAAGSPPPRRRTHNTAAARRRTGVATPKL
jgi:hypothetical protein